MTARMGCRSSVASRFGSHEAKTASVWMLVAASDESGDRLVGSSGFRYDLCQRTVALYLDTAEHGRAGGRGVLV